MNNHNLNNAHNAKSEMKNGLFLKKNVEVNKNDEIGKELDLEFDEEIISRLLCLVHNKNVKHKVLKINNLIDENLYNYIVNRHKENNDFYYKKRNDNINNLGETNNVLFLCYDETNDDCTTCDKYRKNYMSNMQISNNIDINKLNDLNDYFFILGSTSTSRKYILKKSNLNFLSIRIHIDEKKIGCRKKNDPFTLTSNISVAKGLKLLSMIKKDSQLKEQIFELAQKKKIILLVGDEVIYCNNKIYEKPTNQKEATDFLKSYNNNKCFSYSSITLIDYETEKIVTGIDESVINIYDMNDNIIKNILEDSSIYFCAGALKIENIYMHKHINVIKGNIDSIFGLSINLLFHLLTIL
ncbi:hypothetical protein PFHG_00117 [Plasmodium falciparum HB3]|uniref:Maf-like protein n=1 Tax=Plasmodium falciparum (isolate HB3) TaxID=137071 RepID=A0A0L7K5L7_PLAFX|nr:hypothetical protein PFHG_00117 [Plasmodium falciparum HB3]